MESSKRPIQKKFSKFKDIDNKHLFKIFKEKRERDVREELIYRHMYITDILSRKYMNKGIDHEDIKQVASLGLIYAIDRFDPDRGFEFSSFATPTIIGEIKKYFRDKGWSIRVPRRIQELSKKVSNAKEDLQKTLQRAPLISDISDYLGVTDEQVIEAIEASYVYAPRSLDTPIDVESDDYDTSFGDLIGEEDKQFVKFENREFIKSCMEKLDEVETLIIKERYFDEKTQIDVARKLNVSQMTISRMEKKIIKKFRAELSKTRMF